VNTSESGGHDQCHICQTRQTRVTGTGFVGVTNRQPVPVPVTTRDLNLYGFVNP